MFLVLLAGYRSNHPSTERSRKTRDKKFRSSWLAKYKFLQLRKKDEHGQLTIFADHILVGTEEEGSILAGEDCFWICSVCEKWLLEAPSDRLGKGSQRWQRGVCHPCVDRPDVFSQHAESPDHVRLLLRSIADETRHGPHAPPPTITFNAVTHYQLQSMKNVYFCAYYEQSLTQAERYRQRLSVEDTTKSVDVAAPISSYMCLEFVSAIALYIRLQQFLRRSRVRHISGKTWDGATDVSTKDAELFGDQYCNEKGLAVTEFIGRVPVDYKLSRDGRSSDAQAHVLSIDKYMASYGEAIRSLQGCPALHHIDNSLLQNAPAICQQWAQNTPRVCLDGASVNLGEHNGSAAILKNREGCGHLVAQHGAAHNLELAAKDAWVIIDYFLDEWTTTTNTTIAHTGGSCKRLHSTKMHADFAGDNLYAIPSLHGVRWQPSLLKSARHTVNNFRALLMEFHEFGKSHARQSELGSDMRKLFYNTPLESFMGLQFGRRFQTGNRSALHTGTIVAVVAPPDGAKNDLEHPGLKARYQDGWEEFLMKGQVMECLEAGYNAVLEQSKVYAHMTTFSSAKYLRTTAFIADFRSSLARLSELIQRAGVSPISINNKLTGTIAELTLLISTPGAMESGVIGKFDSEREMYLGVPVHGWEEASTFMAGTRRTFLAKLCEALNARVKCDSPLDIARIKMFDFTSIPMGKDEEEVAARASYGNKEVEEWAAHYAEFFDGESQEAKVAALISDWTSIKARYASSTGWQSRTNDSLRTLLYTSLATEYPAWKRNTEIDAASPCDNSDDERWVSALNRIKGKLRSRLGDSTADDLLMISQNGLPVEDVDWETILAIWKWGTDRNRYSGIWKSERVKLAEEMAAALRDATGI